MRPRRIKPLLTRSNDASEPLCAPLDFNARAKARRGRRATSRTCSSKPISELRYSENSMPLSSKVRIAAEARTSLSFGITIRPAAANMSAPIHLHHTPSERFSGMAMIRPAVPVLLVALEPQASVLHGFGHPGGGALGSQSVGLPATILDNATSPKGSPDLRDSVKWFSAPSNTRVLVNVVHGDALSDAARSAAAAKHPSHPLCIANLDTPPPLAPGGR
mmetsp:Transcript_15092/g.37725  ORF Transcript_15092/g.37725 Transcript_15092/m.37725 type:complete len:219 (-) Transcript_15092:217-873(-)